jgi:drug/metabolite transporter (DMT)-like permease
MRAPDKHRSQQRNARLALALLSLSWGVTWPLMRIALEEIPPFSMRAASSGLGILTLAVLVRLGRRSFAVPGRRAWIHLGVAGLLNITFFTMLVAFAQLSAATSRVTILAYSMPIWASLLAWPILGERLDATRGAALLLCAVGIAVLVGPLLGHGAPVGLLLALGAALSWGAGTVYLKWARIGADPVVTTFWQLVISFVVVGVCVPFIDGAPPVWPPHIKPVLALIFIGVVGSGIAYFLWFDSVHRLPAATASIGVLSVPLIGVLASTAILGERPTVPDLIGFALIFVASGFVLLTPAAQENAANPSP